MRMTRSVEVRRPLDEVYRFLVVPENHARFAPGLLEFRQTSPARRGKWAGQPWASDGCSAAGSPDL